VVKQLINQPASFISQILQCLKGTLLPHHLFNAQTHRSKSSYLYTCNHLLEICISQVSMFYWALQT